MIIIAFFVYLVILGANKCKSDQERKQDDEEQIKALKKANEIIKENKKIKERKASSWNLFFRYKDE